MRRVLAFVFVVLIAAWMLLGCLAGGCFFGDDCSGNEPTCPPGEVVSPYGGCYKPASPRDASCSGDACQG